MAQIVKALPHLCKSPSLIMAARQKPLCAPGQMQMGLRLLSANAAETNFLQVSGDRKIAYRKVDPADPSKPTVIFIPGFMSTMDGFKATMLDTLCRKQGLGYVRFDFEGMGQSPGSFETVYFGHWYEDAKSVLEKLVPNKALLIGSSMGGWLSLKLAMDMPEKVAAMVLVAPAINFVKYYYDFFYKMVDDEQKAIMDSGKMVVLKKNYGNIFLRKSFSEESVSHHLNLEEPLKIDVPVRILHGVLDPDVPFMQSIKIMSKLTSLDVDVTFRKEGHHQMSEPADLELLEKLLLTWQL